MKKKVRQNLESRKSEIERRLRSARVVGKKRPPHSEPIDYELSERSRAITQGGMGAICRLAAKTGLARAIDEELAGLLKVHQPYFESDHVLNIAYNSLCGGQSLDDIEQRRRDVVYLDAIGKVSIPDPTTAGDFCRRFDASSIESLMSAFNEVRLRVWSQLPAEFTQEYARIDADGTFVNTLGECKEGAGFTYKKTYGYHPLLISFANTQEPLFIVNRSGNRPSHEGAHIYLDKAAELCRKAGFTKILLRGDTDFSQTRFLDGWHENGELFIYGFDGKKSLVDLADELPNSAYDELVRLTQQVVERKKRTPQRNYKDELVEQMGYKHIEQEGELIAEFDYKPAACRNTYRMVVVVKDKMVSQGVGAAQTLFPEFEYFFYITNTDPSEFSAKQVVFEAAQRCNQENLISQLKASRALHAPVNTFAGNWAYMVMTSLAWSLKAWMALSLPISRRHRKRHLAEQRRWLSMEFRTFLNEVINIPAQIVLSGRRRIFRLLAWRPQLAVFFKLLDAL